jgi:hypothetical protein
MGLASAAAARKRAEHTVWAPKQQQEVVWRVYYCPWQPTDMHMGGKGFKYGRGYVGGLAFSMADVCIDP